VAPGFYAFAPRAVSMTTLLVLTRAELAAYLLYRVLKRGKDARFDEMRGNLIAFGAFWVFQALWAWGVSLPVIYVDTDAAAYAPLDGRDIAGIVIAVVGFIVQVASDLQKDRFRSNRANAGRVCDVGYWAYSRHPNMFGEIMLWWGIWLHGTPVYAASPAGTGYFTLVSPLLTMLLLLCLSGIPTAEGDNQKRFMRTEGDKAAFLAYRRRTSPLVPLPPALYAPLPLWFKRVFLFEWKMYETDWTYVGNASAGGLGGDDKTTALKAAEGGAATGGYGALASGEGGGAS
jgi:steroid 5-alpha reductase family enzyme